MDRLRSFKNMLILAKRQEPEKSKLSPEEHYKAIQRGLKRYEKKVQKEVDDSLKQVYLDSIDEFTSKLDATWGEVKAKGGKKDTKIIELLNGIRVDIERGEKKYTAHSKSAADRRKKALDEKLAKLAKAEELARADWKEKEPSWLNVRPPEKFMKRRDFHAPPTKSPAPRTQQHIEDEQLHFENMLQLAISDQKWQLSHIVFDPEQTCYFEQRKIGEGGVGKVYLATVGGNGTEEEAEMIIAVKIIKNESSNQESPQVDDSCRALLKAKRHVNVVNILAYQFCCSPLNEQRIFMEYISGGTLRNMILSLEGLILVDESKRLVLQIGRGLQHLHTHGFVHRDLKAANILIHLDGCLKICDLDTVRDVSKSTPNETGRTIPWMSPEAARGRYSLRSDVWSLGCVILEILSKRVPWDSEYDIKSEKSMLKLQNDLAQMEDGTEVKGPSLSNNAPPGWTSILESIFTSEDVRIAVSVLLEDDWINS